MIPFVDLGAQYREIKDEIDLAIEEILSSSNFIRGRALDQFERSFSELHNVRHAIGVASGTDALRLAAIACEIRPGDEVITVPNTWISTAFAATYLGAKPVFVDVDPETLQMDISSMKRAVTERTKAVIPVHMFGYPAPVAEILEYCRERQIQVIEDVAQGVLARESDVLAGTIGDVSCFSFYPGKVLGCYGDGGMILTENDDIAAEIRSLCEYGQSVPGSQKHEIVGYNSRLDALQAAILSVKLTYLEDWIEKRRDRANLYRDVLAELPIKLPFEGSNAKPVYHLFVIRTQMRDKLVEFLRERGTMAQVHYPTPLHLQDCFNDLGYNQGDFPVAEAAAQEILSLPLYPELTDGQIHIIADEIKLFFDRYS